jgi:hypothetical protein
MAYARAILQTLGGKLMAAMVDHGPPADEFFRLVVERDGSWPDGYKEDEDRIRRFVTGPFEMLAAAAWTDFASIGGRSPGVEPVIVMVRYSGRPYGKYRAERTGKEYAGLAVQVEVSVPTGPSTVVARETVSETPAASIRCRDDSDVGAIAGSVGQAAFESLKRHLAFDELEKQFDW